MGKIWAALLFACLLGCALSEDNFDFGSSESESSEEEPKKVRPCKAPRDLGYMNLPGSCECPAANFGCVFDDLPHAGHADCTNGGDRICQAVGADYCGGYMGLPPKRTCCIITQVAKGFLPPDNRGCAPSNKGCIFDDYASNTPCYKGGNKLCKEAGLDYCGAMFANGLRRVCCKIAHEPTAQPGASTSEVQCPARTGGCIFDHEVSENSCDKGGNRECVIAGDDYCGAQLDGSRMCCKIPTRKAIGVPIPSARACPAANKGCIFSDEWTNSDCTKDGDKNCQDNGSDYCGAFYGFPPKRSCCNIGKDIIQPVPVPVPAPVAAVPVPVPQPARFLPNAAANWPYQINPANFAANPAANFAANPAANFAATPANFGGNFANFQANANAGRGWYFQKS